LNLSVPGLLLLLLLLLHLEKVHYLHTITSLVTSVPLRIKVTTPAWALAPLSCFSFSRSSSTTFVTVPWLPTPVDLPPLAAGP